MVELDFTDFTAVSVEGFFRRIIMFWNPNLEARIICKTEQEIQLSFKVSPSSPFFLLSTIYSIPITNKKISLEIALKLLQIF